MKKLIYKNEEVNSIIIDESSILSISWINQDQLNLEMLIDWNGQYNLKDEFDFMNIKTRMIFNWITDLKINLDWKNSIGSPGITTFSFKEEPNKTFNINFELDFNATGYIKFNCNDFYFEIIEKS